jgi:hypothetical protein
MNKEILPQSVYFDDQCLLLGLLAPFTIQEIDGKSFSLIPYTNILKFFEYFIKDKNRHSKYLFDFIYSHAFRHSLLKIFFEDESGWHSTSFNSKTEKFNKTDLPFHKLFYCTETFLRNVSFLELYKDLDGTAHNKVSAIRQDNYSNCINDILDLKYYLETRIDLRSDSSVEKSLNKKLKTSKTNCTSRSPSRFTKMIKSLKAKPEYDSPEKLWEFLYGQASKGASANQAFRDEYEFLEFGIKQGVLQTIRFKTVESKGEGSMQKSSFQRAYRKA